MNCPLRHTCRKPRKRLRAAAESMAAPGGEPCDKCVYVCLVLFARQVGDNEKRVSRASTECQGWAAGGGRLGLKEL